MTNEQDPVLRSSSGSGELELEMAISKLRTAILRAVNELDNLCVATREARGRIERLGVELKPPRPKK